MVICSACLKELIIGGLCPDCGRVFCEDTKECHMCRFLLLPIKINKETINNFTVDWVVLKNSQIVLELPNRLSCECGQRIRVP
jgi:hypothetical protein